MNAELYFEDFSIGQTFGSGAVTLTAEQIKAFARDFDPQPFHTDETAAAQSFFGGLVASGWHTAALTMRLLVESELRVAGGLVGVGLDEVKWMRPVRPGDELRLTLQVREARPSRSLPRKGLVRIETVTLNQEDQPVLSFIANLLVPRREM